MKYLLAYAYEYPTEGPVVVACRVRDDTYPGVTAEVHLAREVYPPSYRHHLIRLTLGGGDRLNGWQIGDPDSRDDFHPVREIRDLPIARWVRGAKLVAQQAAIEEHLTESTTVMYTWDEPDVSFLAEELLERLFPDLDQTFTPAGLRRRKHLQHLARVAVIYDHSVAKGREDPAAEVARYFKAVPGTARTWVHRARKEGLIGATAPQDVSVLQLGEVELPMTEEQVQALADQLERERAQLKLELAKINAAKERGNGPE